MAECKDTTSNRLSILTLCSGEAANTAGKYIIGISKKLQEKKYNVIIITTKGEWLHEIKTLGVRWYEASSIRTRTPYGIFESIRIIRNVIITEKIDLIHVHSVFHALEAYIARLMLPNKRTIPIVMTEHILHRGERWAYYIGVKALNILADFVTTVSAFEQERLIKAGLKRNKVQIIHNAINLTECDKYIEKSESFEFPRMIQKPAFVGIIARLSPEKNHKCFLEAAAQVKKSFPETKFLIVGEGPLKDELEKLTKRLELEKNVIFMGFQKNTYKILKDMDMLVLPSVRETFGMVLIEAMAMGKPVIATKVGGILEVVKDRETGLLVSPGDSTALSQAIEALLKDRELAQKLGIQGRQYVEAKFNLDVTIGQTEDLYKKAISKRPEGFDSEYNKNSLNKKGVMWDKLERERDFHDELAKQGFHTRRLLNRMAQAFYDKQIVWGEVWDEIGDLRGKTVLDYGCGAGGFSFELAKRGAKVYGIDISQETIALAKTLGSALNVCSPNFLVGDTHETGFQSNFFDFVFGNGILHHLELEKAFPEIKRILKPKGIGWFMEPLDKHPAVWIVRHFTPKARSTTEKPLSFNDIYFARKFFKGVTHKEYFLLSLAATPMHLVNIRLARSVVRLLHSVDQAIFRMIHWTRRLAWITLIKVEK